VTVTDSEVTGNSTSNGGSGDPSGNGGNGGGIYSSDGVVTVENSTIDSNTTGDGGYGAADHWGGEGGLGGGIYHWADSIDSGSLWVMRSTVSNNRCGDGGDADENGSHGGSGGGVLARGSTVMLNSTISGNRTGIGGSGSTSIGSGGYGGGLLADGTVVSITHSTISSNTTGIGAASGHGGGIATGGSVIVNVKNVILADNTSTVGPDCNGTLTSYGFNLIETISGCTPVLAENPGTSVVGQDPMLMPLRNNGGDTWTQALSVGSPAIDSGSCLSYQGQTVAVDQRGWSRPIDGDGDSVAECDMGAYEVPLHISLPMVLKE
jgi:hypothetical protein